MSRNASPSSNMGAKLQPKAPQIRNKQAGLSVFIDFLSITLKNGTSTYEAALNVALDTFSKAGRVDINRLRIQNNVQGYQGWAHSALLLEGSTTLALLAWGGSTQRDRFYVSFTGKGCELLNGEAYEHIKSYAKKFEGKITRIDLSVDDIDGVHNLNGLRRRYSLGQFNAGGRKPEKREYSSNQDKGDSIYVGGKQSSKQLRAYQKGKQLGRPDSGWVRFELQLRHQSNRPIQLDALTDPAPYFVGAYPALERMFKNLSSSSTRIKTTTAITHLSLEKLLTNISRSSGSAIGFLLSAGANAQRLVDYVRRPPGRYAKQFNRSFVDSTLTEMRLTNHFAEPP